MHPNQTHALYLAIPFVADATATQHHNRYSYALNNPMKYTDSTGYMPPQFQSRFRQYYSNFWDIDDNNGMGAESYINGFARQLGPAHSYSSMGGSGGGSYSGSDFSINQLLKSWGINIPNFDINSSYQISSLGNGNYSIGTISNSDISDVYDGSVAITVGLWYRDANGRPTIIDNFSGEFYMFHLDIPKFSENDALSPPKWMGDVNYLLGAFGIGNGAKTELIDYTVRNNYKSANNLREFNKLRSTQQAWRTTNTLGKTGSLYLNGAKLLGKGVFGVTVINSSLNAGSAFYNDDPNKWGVAGKATLDVTMGYIGFLGPIGFGISATYFILDASGAFNSWSQPVNR